MKEVKYFVYGVLLFIIGLGVTNAASLSVSTNKRTVTVGSNVVVTVSASGAAGWEYCLSYDTSIYSLVSSTSDTGGACVRTGSTLIGYSKVTYTLRANKSGSSTVGLREYAMYDDAGEKINASAGSVNLTAKTQQEIEASYSTDADLRSLSVNGYELTPSFSKNTLEYNLEVENDVESVDISATKSDSGAHVTGVGKKELSEGINKFEVVVTAEKGNKKTYTITINRKELNPITVNVDGNSYNVVRKSDSLEAPTYYSSTTTTIEDTEVPAFTSEITGYTLVGLKDEEGNISLYIYENNSYRLYKQVGNEGFIFIIEEISDRVDGYENKKSITINDVETDVYYKNEDDDIVLVYGMNASNGVKNWYRYDIKEGTFQRYIKEENTGGLLTNNDYFYLTIAFAGGLALAILIIIVLLSMLSKKDKQRNKLIEYIESKKTNNEETDKSVKEDLLEVKEETKKEEVTPKKTRKRKKKIEEVEIDPELEELNTQFLDFIDKDAQDKKEESKAKANKEVKEAEVELSKRELRRLEKEQKEAEEKELQEMRDDFLNTKENEIVDDSDILEEVETNKKNKKKTKKKKSSK